MEKNFLFLFLAGRKEARFSLFKEAVWIPVNSSCFPIVDFCPQLAFPPTLKKNQNVRHRIIGKQFFLFFVNKKINVFNFYCFTEGNDFNNVKLSIPSLHRKYSVFRSPAAPPPKKKWFSYKSMSVCRSIEWAFNKTQNEKCPEAQK